MDIDLLWAVGGWLILLINSADCMATLKTSSSSSSRFFETTTSSKSQNPFLGLFLGLIFIFLVVVVHSSDPSNNINPAASSLDSTQTLVPHDSSSFSSSSSPSPSPSTMNLHPRRSKDDLQKPASSNSSGREFEAGEHEVPSGPNPISN